MSTYNLQFDMLCARLGLGAPISPPWTLTGGHMHRMFALETTQRLFAVKALSPEVMARPEARDNILAAEAVARAATRAGLPALPALVFTGGPIQAVEGQDYLVFAWAQGATLPDEGICPAHCAMMGEILARLHEVPMAAPLSTPAVPESPIHWYGFVEQGEAAGAVWAGTLRKDVDKLTQWNERLAAAQAQLAGNTVLSHRDLEPKNVLWHAAGPTLIDWEAAGPIHPLHDLAETAGYWSRGAQGALDETRYMAIVQAYRAVRPTPQADWDAVLAFGYGSLLGWLAFSLRRSLGVGLGDAAERAMGTAHAVDTLAALHAYERRLPRLALLLRG